MTVRFSTWLLNSEEYLKSTHARFCERDHLTFPLLLNTVLLISRLCMADLRTCPEISCLYMAGQSVKAVGRGYEKPHFRETDCHI